LHFTVQVKYNSLEQWKAISLFVKYNSLVTVHMHSNQSMFVLGWNPSPAHAAGLSPAL
jgi:hypothetical protein